MKKIIIALIVITALFAGFGTYRYFSSDPLSYDGYYDDFYYEENGSYPGEEPANMDEYLDSFDYDSYFSNLKYIDYDALSALHDPDDVVCTVNGEDIAWKNYYYSLRYYASGLEQTIDYAPLYYGIELSWDDDYQDGVTYAMAPATLCETRFLSHAAVLKMAEENGIELTEEDLDDALAEDIKAAGVEDEDAFFAYLAEQNIDRDTYDFVTAENVLANRIHEELYAGKEDDETIQKFNDELKALTEGFKVDYAEGFKLPDMKDFLK